MTKTELLNLIGGVVLFAFSALLAWVARYARRFDRYGQEALGCAAAWIFVVGLMRVLNLVDVVSVDFVRSVNTLGAVIFLVIVGQVIWLRRVEKVNGVKREEET